MAEFKKLQKPQKRSKYNNKKTEYAGRLYDSKKEAEYAKHLEYLKHAKKLEERVTKIEYQVPYKIYGGKTVCSTYFADFVVHYGDGRIEIVDVKGMKTPVYRLKKKLVEACYGLKIKEV